MSFAAFLSSYIRINTYEKPGEGVGAMQDPSSQECAKAHLRRVSVLLGVFGRRCRPEGIQPHLRRKYKKGGQANRPSPQSPKGILGSRPPIRTGANLTPFLTLLVSTHCQSKPRKNAVLPRKITSHISTLQELRECGAECGGWQ
jgi:hypothetical protein